MDTTPVPAITEIKRFYSKRNTVFLGHLQVDGLPHTVVVKQYRREAEAQREEAVLKELNGKGVRVPLPYGRCGRILLLPYLEGPLLTELLETRSKSMVHIWTKELAAWFWSLHNLDADKTGRIRLKGDVNPRNFIFFQERFWGLDFEEEFYGPPSRDIGEMCAFILSNRPSFTADKIEAAALFARCYLRLNSSVTGEEIEEETAAALERMVGRRSAAESESIKNFLKDSQKRKLLYWN